MARYFTGGVLPPVQDVREVHRRARDLAQRGVPISPGEAALLRQVTWCLLQAEQDEDAALTQALGRLAALTLAVIEDDDFSIPAGYGAGSRVALEGLAVQLERTMEQADLQLAVAMASHDVTVASAADLAARLPHLPDQADLRRAAQAAAVHLRQGEGLLAGQTDPERRERHAARLEQARDRTARLLARLLAIPAASEPAELRDYVVRRELRRIEVDALGAERLSEAEQIQRTRDLLSWATGATEESVSDVDAGTLAERLQAAAAEQQTAGDDDWLFAME